MKTRLCSFFDCLVLLFCLLLPPIAFAEQNSQRPADFGKQWVRSHPFTIMGLAIRPDEVTDDKYSQANFTAFLAWRQNRDPLFTSAVRQNLPWHAHLVEKNYDKKMVGSISEVLKKQLHALLRKYSGGQGILVWDEPKKDEYEDVAEFIAWVKRTYPDLLVYSDALPGDPAYLNAFIKVIKPDVLLSWCYPFRTSPDEEPTSDINKDYFRVITDIRNVSLNSGLPYWLFVQTYGGEDKHRIPSESDLRLNIYSALALGFKGILYFTYGPFHAAGGLLRTSGNPRYMDLQDVYPSNLYYEAVRINAEISNIGRLLRFLTSRQVYHIPGEHKEKGKFIPNIIPDALVSVKSRNLKTWKIKSIRIKDKGKGRNGLLGLFEDDKGSPYFMLVNLSHGPDATADEKSLTFMIDFYPGTRAISRLSRETGKVEKLFIETDSLEVTLPGGTGDLFFFNNTIGISLATKRVNKKKLYDLPMIGPVQ